MIRPGSVFDVNMTWAEKCYPRMKDIFAAWAGPQLFVLRKGDLSGDMKHLEDMVLEVRKLRWVIGLRVRDVNIPERDFTLRTTHVNHPSELEKIKNGAGTYYLYAWAGKVDCKIYDWMIVDLNAFRARAWAFPPPLGWRCGYKDFRHCNFKWFGGMGPDVVIARSRSLMNASL